MAPLRSIGNKDSAFDDFYASTGTDASSAILKASGGDFEFVENGFEYHVFTTAGTSNLVFTSSHNIEYVIAGGGGGGGAYRGGGGGAGALNSNMPGFPGTYSGVTFPVSSGTYEVVVGAGGAARPYGPVPTGNGNEGSTSRWNPGGTNSGTPVEAPGGGYGAGPPDGTNESSHNPGGPGGSGGGGQDNTGPNASTNGGSASTGTGGIGNRGGNNPPPNQNFSGAGGGGAGGQGNGFGPDIIQGAGFGGDGYGFPTDQVPPSFGTPGPYGFKRYFCGGGGGYVYSGFPNPRRGGTGGGGPGSPSPAGEGGTDGGVTGTTNSGGGGGGGTNGGGGGGPGIVIIRFAV